MAVLRQPIRLVTFDALYTIITPRLPIHVQYSQAFEPYLGVLDPSSLKQSFRVGMWKSNYESKFGLGLIVPPHSAFHSLEREQPVYGKGSQAWWSEVIRRTALGAGANEKALDVSLHSIVSQLLDRFSSKEGYRAFDDAIEAVHTLRELNVQTAVVSNADSRIRSVLRDLDFPTSLSPMVLSEEEGVEKPSPEIYRRMLSYVNSGLNEQNLITPEQCLHVGDELDADYDGAQAAGMKALLLRRAEPRDEQAHKAPKSVSLERNDVEVVENLRAVTHWVATYNNTI
ncbi:hypothetical protein DXG01_012203 [Tephrocybe rancida]|nr:hypothetical protein DXG01_012203 [Tephrocybe rancida]